MPLSRIGLSQNQTVTGNVTFSGTGNRIIGDYSNATIANRVAFQTNLANGSTTIMAVPNGSGTASQLLVRSSSTAADDQFGQFVIVKDQHLRIATSNTGNAIPLAMSIQTSGVERINVSANGVVTLANGQLQFPATQQASSDPNTLDDYEEGTWTPVFGYSGGNGTMSASYANQFGYYTKIGNLVYLRLDLRFTSFIKGTASGSPWIVGLPFTPQNNAGYGSAIFVAGTYQWAFSSSPPIASVRQDGTPAIQLSRMVSNSVHANLDDPDGDAMIFQTVVYQV